MDVDRCSTGLTKHQDRERLEETKKRRRNRFLLEQTDLFNHFLSFKEAKKAGHADDRAGHDELEKKLITAADAPKKSGKL